MRHYSLMNRNDSTLTEQIIELSSCDCYAKAYGGHLYHSKLNGIFFQVARCNFIPQ